MTDEEATLVWGGGGGVRDRAPDGHGTLLCGDVTEHLEEQCHVVGREQRPRLIVEDE